jgi:hypothetical protein
MKQICLIFFVSASLVFEHASAYDFFLDDNLIEVIQVKLDHKKCIETLEGVKQDTGIVRTTCYIEIFESGKLFSLVKPKENERFSVKTEKLGKPVTVILEKYEDKIKIVGEYPRSAELIKFLYSRDTFKALVGDIVKNIPNITVQVE